MEKIYIKGLEIFAFHGVNPEEKENGQKFILDITLTADLSAAMATDDLACTVNYAAVRKTVQRVMTGAKYNLIEHTAAAVADAILAEYGRVERVEICLKKPDAPMNAVFDYVAVEIARDRRDTPVPQGGQVPEDGSLNQSPASGPAPEAEEALPEDDQDREMEEAAAGDDSALGKGKQLLRKLAGSRTQRAYIALGSNMGDRGENLNRAVWALASIPGIRIGALSRVYETKPVGYARQENFYNAVIRVDTTLTPRALLGACLGIEAGMGRLRGRKNGPRVIDLDLLLYEGKVCQSEELTLPHPRMEERAFVLSPLCDILQDPYYLGCLKRVDRSGVKSAGVSLIKP